MLPQPRDRSRAAGRSWRTGPIRRTAAAPGSGSAGQWAIRASVRSGAPGRMERVAEQHERRVRGARFRGGQARDAAAVRLAADDDPSARDGTTWWNAGMASSALRLGRSIAVAVDAAGSQALDERCHAGRRPATRRAPDSSGDPSSGSVAVGSGPFGRPRVARRVMAGRTARSGLVGCPAPGHASSTEQRGPDHAVRRSPPVPGSACSRSPWASRPRAARRRRHPVPRRRPAAGPARCVDAARRDRHVPRPRLRPRRGDVPVRRPRSGARRRRRRPRSSPTTTAAPTLGSIPVDTPIRVRVLNASGRRPTRALVAVRPPRRRGAIDGMAAEFPNDARIEVTPDDHVDRLRSGRDLAAQGDRADRHGPALGDDQVLPTASGSTSTTVFQVASRTSSYDTYRGASASACSRRRRRPASRTN